MRNLIFAFAMTSVLYSCSSESDFNSAQFPQIWQLTEMSGSFSAAPPATGSDMDWQETYELKSDSTFTKTRERDGTTTSENGTFSFVTLSDGDYLRLTYHDDNDLIGNCSSEPVEFLSVAAINELTATWLACDGPGLKYKRVR